MSLFFKNIKQRIAAILPLRKKMPKSLSLVIKVLIFISVSAHLVATRHPWLIVYKDHLWFPAFSTLFEPNRVEQIDLEDGRYETIEFEHTNWKALKSSFVIWAPIPWSANVPDAVNRNFKSPFEQQIDSNSEPPNSPLPYFFRHHLGTDALGNDVLAGLIHGLGNSMFIALCSTAVALFLGLLLGLTSGYWGNFALHFPIGTAFFGATGIILGFFWAFQLRAHALSEAAHEGIISFSASLLWSTMLFAITAGIFMILGKILSRIKLLNKRITLPYDGAIQRFTETFNALPKILLILTIAGAFDAKNIMLLVLILGGLQWTGIARLTRIETMKIRKMPFVETALLQGYSTRRILLIHVLPSVIGVVLVEATFIFAGSVLIESSLSFLGLGLPDSSYTLGTLLKNGRNHPTAWWMTVFPGLMIFILTWTANSLGKWLTSKTITGAAIHQSP